LKGIFAAAVAWSPLRIDIVAVVSDDGVADIVKAAVSCTTVVNRQKTPFKDNMHPIIVSNVAIYCLLTSLIIKQTAQSVKST
jgi:hypothetical protein